MTDTELHGLAAIWMQAAEQRFRGMQWVSTLPEEIQDLSPRWWTPIAELNHMTHGGVFGTTGIGGSAGGSKSFFAMACALHAALEDHRTVVYVAAEMTEHQILGRFGWLARHWGHAWEDLDLALRERLFLIRCEQSMEFREFATWVASSLMGEDDALLVVDSINSLLRRFHDRLGYWQRYEMLLDAIEATRVKTEGRFASILLSELNQRGGSKGEKLEYAADLMLNFKKMPTPRVVRVSVVKNRERGDDGVVGEFQITPEGGYRRIAT